MGATHMCGSLHVDARMQNSSAGRPHAVSADMQSILHRHARPPRQVHQQRPVSPGACVCECDTAPCVCSHLPASPSPSLAEPEPTACCCSAAFLALACLSSSATIALLPGRLRTHMNKVHDDCHAGRDPLPAASCVRQGSTFTPCRKNHMQRGRRHQQGAKQDTKATNQLCPHLGTGGVPLFGVVPVCAGAGG